MLSIKLNPIRAPSIYLWSTTKVAHIHSLKKENLKHTDHLEFFNTINTNMAKPAKLLYDNRRMTNMIENNNGVSEIEPADSIINRKTKAFI